MSFFNLVSIVYLLCITPFLSYVHAAPHGNGGVYEINPPATDLVYFTLEYYDVDTKQMELHDIVIELYGTVVPNTTFNFKGLSDGVKALMPNEEDKKNAVTVGYQNKPFHRIISDFMMQGGDVLPEIGPFSLFGYKFDDENFWLKHDRPGRLSMANSGADSNASQFFITFKSLPDLDGKHVVFGQVIQGMDVLLDKIQYLETENDKDTQKVKIVYSKAQNLRLKDEKSKHKEYLEKVNKYREGVKDESNSVSYDPMTEGKTKSYQDMHSLTQTGKVTEYGGGSVNGGNGTDGVFFDLTMFLLKIGGIATVAFYGYKYWKKSRNSNKVVGLRHD
ncbi:hypothetical protein ACO0QE_000812 [Hanseniaspora vineae]